MAILASTITRLQYLCETIPSLLYQIDSDEFSLKPTPEKWSKKQVIGHLIDSATNNHHRMIRAQFESTPSISYDQNEWNKCGHYQEIGKEQIIRFWTSYNQQLLALIQLIPEEKLRNLINIKGEIVTLQFVIEDYVQHMEHHLHQVVKY